MSKKIPIAGTDAILTDLNSGKVWSIMDLGPLDGYA
jgi:hypothetical protein